MRKKWKIENGKIPISQDPNLAPAAARSGSKWKTDNGKVEDPDRFAPNLS
jgi:hypothetical protein